MILLRFLLSVFVLSVAAQAQVSIPWSDIDNGYFNFTGPSGAVRTYTLPNADATLARTDAGQTFSGAQVFSSTINGNTLTTGTGTLTLGSVTLNAGPGGTLGTAAFTSATAYATQVSSIAAIKALTVANFVTGSSVNVLGYYAAGDGGGGLFYYNSASVGADNGGTVIQPTTGAGRWLRSYSGALNVRWFGAKGDGSTDDATAIQSAITLGNTLFPAGSFSITASITVPSYRTITGARGATILWSGSNPGSTNTGLFSATAQSHITIQGLEFQSIYDRVYGARFVACTDFQYLNNQHNGCSVVATDSSAVSWVLVDESNSCLRFQISDCTGYGSGNGVEGAIYLAYARDGSISNCVLKNYNHGIQFWGGNSDPSVNGAAVNERKAQRISISGISVYGVTQGGIWGSMGEAISISNCNVKDTGDVGIDFEGCFNSTATGNTVEDAVFGGLTTFWLCQNVAFVGNSVTSSVSGRNLIQQFNATLDPSGVQNISYVGNVFKMTASSGVGYASASQGPATLWKFSDNVLLNVCVVSGASGSRNDNVQITGNLLKFTNVVDANGYGIGAFDIGNLGTAVISGNIIFSTVTQPTTSYGIRVGTDEFTNPSVYQIKDNRVRAFFGGVYVDFSGNNVPAYFNIFDNILGGTVDGVGSVVTVSDTGSGTPVVMQIGNFTSDNLALDENSAFQQTISGAPTPGGLYRTGTKSYTTRSIGSGSNITVSNGDGSAGPPTISLPATITSMSSVVGSGALTLQGGSSGGAIVLGSGANGGATVNAAGNGGLLVYATGTQTAYSTSIENTQPLSKIYSFPATATGAFASLEMRTRTQNGGEGRWTINVVEANNSSSFMTFKNIGNERGRLTDSGNLLWGTTSETGLTGAGGVKIGSATEATTGGAASIITPGGIYAAKSIVGLHYIGGGTAPGVAAGVGAGTTPTVTLSRATDSSFTLNVTTGTIPTAASVVATVTFNTAYTAAPHFSITPANAATALLTGVTMVYGTSTTTTFVLNAGPTGLTGATPYVWEVLVHQ